MLKERPLAQAVTTEQLLTGSSRSTRPMAVARAQHTSTLLPTGKVIIAGGRRGVSSSVSSSVEVYDPATGA
ncbi:kelch repeat-containing protein [Archangium violaceum]|uniref:kelch repeat-containing protein n=1 Tax=Archangium violaceum TaxID=83451 RepID=UPI002B2F29CD|nr:kelch repeat-containing protein [Archangium gephyra]